MRRLIGSGAQDRDSVVMEGPLGAHGGVWKRLRDPALADGRCTALRQGTAMRPGRAPGRIAVGVLRRSPV